ncbi:MAG: hypothetical protein A2745_02770 [Candidatus Harrisonbacteria bacterium RIFCSPHIGHO2_01_FULL_44_13]|nr:MAG: hypothetical protein A2745_02770 [Candidatus Harrisonbacteria bacterium RIFCSPHIGHO2_01_FULL_44_13]
MKDVIIFAKTNFRNQQIKFGIKADDRRRHMYIIGKTGMGKTTMLENMVIADILAGRGVAVVDPHGEFADKILDFIPENRIDDVVYFNPHDIEHPIAFNPLEQVGTEFRHLVASGIMGVFKKIWIDLWSARMEYILNNTLLALLEYPGSTLLGIMRMLADKDYRKRVVDNLKDPVVKSFWVNEFSRYSQKFETEATAAIQNKVGQFVTNPLIRNILGQSNSLINMRKIMDEGKILIVNLAKGKIGEDNSALLGAMIITKLQQAAMSRVDVPEEKRKDFYLYVDEFQNFATDSFAAILSEARKYRLCLILANQYIEQLSEKVKPAVFGNVGSIALFRVGAEDAEFLEKEFEPDFIANDLVNLTKYDIYIKLMIDGIASRPFSATTLEPNLLPPQSFRDSIIANSRSRYTMSRQKVEEKISREWMSGSENFEEKAMRRDEQPLARALSGQPQSFARRRERPYGAEPSGYRPSFDHRDQRVDRREVDRREPDRREGMPQMVKPLEPLPGSSTEIPVPRPKAGMAAEGLATGGLGTSRPLGPRKEKPKINIDDLRQVLDKALHKDEQ